jgi:CheY-like chemotaxis protein
MPHKILIVDDEVRIAQTLALILRQTGYVTAFAYDGASALAMSAVFQPDLLLTDLLMPGMNGMELALAILRKDPQCKVLLFSGQAGAGPNALCRSHTPLQAHPSGGAAEKGRRVARLFQTGPNGIDRGEK